MGWPHINQHLPHPPLGLLTVERLALYVPGSPHACVMFWLSALVILSSLDCRKNICFNHDMTKAYLIT